MQFYRLRNTLDIKEIGRYPQIKDVTHLGIAYGNPKFIGEIYFSKIEFEPEVSMPILHSNAKLTDLIEQVPTTPFKILISGKLKGILESYREDGIQFFQGAIFHNGIEYSDYWYLNMYVINNEYIDYANSIINWEKKNDDYDETYGTTPIELKFSSFEDFNKKMEEARLNLETFNVKKLILKDVKEDFFILRDIEGGAGYFVSETLKKEIEDTGCTGIEFQPSELSYNEWLAPGGERERVYGKSW